MLRTIPGGLALTATICFAAAASAQQQRPVPRTPIVVGSVSLASDGTLRVTAPLWEQQTRTETYTVEVPVVEERTVTEDGKQVTKQFTVTRTEQRTREVIVMVSKANTTEVPKGDYTIYQMGGAKLASIGSTDQPAVLVGPGEKLDTWYRSLLRSDALVVVIRRLPAAEPPLAPSLEEAPAPELPTPEPPASRE